MNAVIAYHLSYILVIPSVVASLCTGFDTLFEDVVLYDRERSALRHAGVLKDGLAQGRPFCQSFGAAHLLRFLIAVTHGAVGGQATVKIGRSDVPEQSHVVSTDENHVDTSLTKRRASMRSVKMKDETSNPSNETAVKIYSVKDYDMAQLQEAIDLILSYLWSNWHILF